jgi:hypothetical protein
LTKLFSEVELDGEQSLCIKLSFVLVIV